MEIDLSGTGISDASIEVLTSFPRLAKIVLLDTKISEYAMVRLRAASPRCEIIR